VARFGVITWTFNPGELRRRIQIERDTITRVNGAEVKTPGVYTTTWAKAECSSGKELLQGQQIASDVTWVFTLRYRTDLLPQDRVYYQGERMEIRAIVPDDLNRDSVVLLCESRGKGPAVGTTYLPGGGGVVSFADQESPTGTIDGTNATFALAHTPNPAASLTLYRNGLLQKAGGQDYTLSGTAIAFVSGAIPQSGDTLLAWYRY